MTETSSEERWKSSSGDQRTLKEGTGGAETEVFRFGPFRLSGAAPELYLGSEPLPLTPKALDTLLVLVSRAGEIVSREELIRDVWQDDFVEEAVLTQNVYTLRKVLGEADPDGRYIETVPRRGYRFLARVRREPAAARPTPGPKRRLALAGVALALVVAVLFLAGRALRRNEGTRAEVGSLAVLPFLPLSPGEEGKALGLGMADALIIRLSKLETVSMRPTSAVRSFTAAERDAAELARTLGVDAVIDGTIQRAGDSVRLSVQLIHRSGGGPLWADRFDAVMTDLFQVQDSIAERVAAALRVELAGGSASVRQPVHPDAYQAYLTGRYFWNLRSGDSLRKAVASFEQALALEPDYARAHAGLADALVLLPLYGNLRPVDALPRAISEAATALSLDPNLAEAHNTLAYARFVYEWDWDRAERGFRRAIQLDPSYAPAHHWYSYFLTARGRHDEAIAEIGQALALDPVSLIINADAGLVFYFARRFEDAERQLRATLELDADFAYAHFGLGMVLEAMGRTEEAIAEARAAAQLTDGSSAMLGALGRALGADGRETEAMVILGTLFERAGREYVQAGHIAMIYTGLGRTEDALTWWQRAVEERSRFVPFFDVWPVLAGLRDECPPRGASVQCTMFV